jgi:hypothetical protein
MKDCDNSAIITQKQEEGQRAYKQEFQKQHKEEDRSRNNTDSDSDSDNSLSGNISIGGNISFS